MTPIFSEFHILLLLSLMLKNMLISRYKLTTSKQLELILTIGSHNYITFYYNIDLLGVYTIHIFKVKSMLFYSLSQLNITFFILF